MKVIYTYTDEAPALATHSLLPIIRAFAGPAGVEIELRDISLAGRILAQFGHAPDALAELGELAKTPEANIIKLPNISASIPQLKAAIKELQDAGYAIPDYEDDPEPYDRVKGSAVNPVLREGNSDRRAPASVKAYARKHPHPMGEWSSSSKTHVATMSDGDFRHSEKSVTMERDDVLRIELDSAVLRDGLKVLKGEIVDAAVMRRRALDAFLHEQVEDAKAQGVLFSLHMKATMMKVSDPIIFGHGVRAYFADVFNRHGDELPSPNNGLGAVLASAAPEVEEAIKHALATGPALAMVDSDRGITSLHVPSDVIIDASMPAMIRSSGQMWNAAGEPQDAKAVIPDSSYAALYAETIAHCKEHGAFDPPTMGTTPNVGLMAQKAEEYGSHDKTFEIEAPGTVRIVTAGGETLLEHDVEAGDVWRACQTKDAPVRDWVRLAVERARATGAPAVFWLDEARAHDAQVLAKVREELERHDTDGLQLEILPVAEATRFTLERARAGEDTISVTGNVLRDYLTDLFPILELGTSAKMLSIVPLMHGGGLFETGAGGSAPKHVQQLVKENHLRWDSLGEFLALAVSLEMLAEKDGNERAAALAKALDAATGQVLENGKSPSRKVGELDNRGSHFYLALYWAQALVEAGDDAYDRLARRLADQEDEIAGELAEVQGAAVDLGGYYFVDREKADAVMRPSAAFDAAIDEI
jgi:isocitrate dehydrogenase